MTHVPDRELTRRVIECATEVHDHMGAGFSKDIYENCLAIELTAAGLAFERGRVLPLIYDGVELDYRCKTDFIVAASLLVQIEAVDEIELPHEQKLRTCIFLGQFSSGLLLNFNAMRMEDGITEMTGATQSPSPIETDVFDDPDLGATF